MSIKPGALHTHIFRDGRGCRIDDISIEQHWLSLKQETVKPFKSLGSFATN